MVQDGSLRFGTGIVYLPLVPRCCSFLHFFLPQFRIDFLFCLSFHCYQRPSQTFLEHGLDDPIFPPPPTILLRPSNSILPSPVHPVFLRVRFFSDFQAVFVQNIELRETVAFLFLRPNPPPHTAVFLF